MGLLLAILLIIKNATVPYGLPVIMPLSIAAVIADAANIVKLDWSVFYPNYMNQMVLASVPVS